MKTIFYSFIAVIGVILVLLVEAIVMPFVHFFYTVPKMAYQTITGEHTAVSKIACSVFYLILWPFITLWLTLISLWMRLCNASADHNEYIQLLKQ